MNSHFETHQIHVTSFLQDRHSIVVFVILRYSKIPAFSLNSGLGYEKMVLSTTPELPKLTQVEQRQLTCNILILFDNEPSEPSGDGSPSQHIVIHEESDEEVEQLDSFPDPDGHIHEDSRAKIYCCGLRSELQKWMKVNANGTLTDIIEITRKLDNLEIMPRRMNTSQYELTEAIHIHQNIQHTNNTNSLLATHQHMAEERRLRTVDRHNPYAKCATDSKGKEVTEQPQVEDEEGVTIWKKPGPSKYKIGEETESGTEKEILNEDEYEVEEQDLDEKAYLMRIRTDD
ncbi:10491_t:CDS:2 [Ambispora leptoticha]|uniref:10491_t:CDS:1 n=1 Tax=Ambispora leptoticha TaxID=144679 RepID=A0A9N9BME2_9GLOM|nr:10491_t:CDS:2 [Ambispora leptoticha]